MGKHEVGKTEVLVSTASDTEGRFTTVVIRIS